MRELHLAVGAVVLLSIQSGCATRHLRYNTVTQAAAVADVHTQQVLDNLAKFAANPNAMPYFTFTSSSTSDVTDTIPATQSFSFTPFGLASWGMGTGLTRGARQSYSTEPVTDPRKLELMRCAYQRAIGNCCCSSVVSCANCEKLFNNFYLGQTIPGTTQKLTADGTPIWIQPGDNERELIKLGKGSYADVAFPNIAIPIDDTDVVVLAVEKTISLVASRSGETTIECIDGECWFNTGTKHDVSKLTQHYVGHRGNTYVWVPEQHVRRLTDLTLVILDIATKKPIEKPKKREIEVKLNLDYLGHPIASAKDAFYHIKTTVTEGTDVTKLFESGTVTMTQTQGDSGDEPPVNIDGTSGPSQALLESPAKPSFMIQGSDGSIRNAAPTDKLVPGSVPARKNTEVQNSLFDFQLRLDTISP